MLGTSTTLITWLKIWPLYKINVVPNKANECVEIVAGGGMRNNHNRKISFVRKLGGGKLVSMKNSCSLECVEKNIANFVGNSKS